MGQDQSDQANPLSQYGQIYIKLTRSCYQPGQQVYGDTYLNLTKAFPGNELILKCKGIESAWFQEREEQTKTVDGVTRREITPVYHRATRTIIKTKNIVHNWKDKEEIPPSQYIFPFTFLLPQAIPNTFYQKGGKNESNMYEAQVSYSIKACLKSNNKQVSNLFHRIPLVIVDPKAGSTISCSQMMAFPIHTCWCFSRGAVFISCLLEKSSYRPGETVKGTVEINNLDCNVAINRVNLQICQHLRIKSQTQKQKNFRFIISALQYRGIGQNQAVKGKNALAIEAKIPRSAGRSGSLLSKNKGDQTLESTMIGEFIDSQYFIEIFLEMGSWSYFGDQPRLVLPLTVYDSNLEETDAEPQVKKPKNWNPTINELAVISLTNASAETELPSSSASNLVKMSGELMSKNTGLTHRGERKEEEIVTSKSVSNDKMKTE